MRKQLSSVEDSFLLYLLPVASALSTSFKVIKNKIIHQVNLSCKIVRNRANKVSLALYNYLYKSHYMSLYFCAVHKRLWRTAFTFLRIFFLHSTIVKTEWNGLANLNGNNIKQRHIHEATYQATLFANLQNVEIKNTKTLYD